MWFGLDCINRYTEVAHSHRVHKTYIYMHTYVYCIPYDILHMVGNSHHMLFTQHTTYYLLPRVHGIGKLEISYIKRTIWNKKKMTKNLKEISVIGLIGSVYFHHPETTYAFPNTEMRPSSICGQRVTMNSMTIAKESGS